uniref:Uncharacterized protein n=1 Tax=Opuntia streptacantha TaxID=393608 RepID=A0A7C9CN74_OPUST
MRPSRIVIYCVALVMLFFFFQDAGLSFSAAPRSSSLHSNLSGRVPRRVLSIFSTQQHIAGSTQGPSVQKVHNKAKFSNNSNQNDDDDNDDLVYHIDYHGVMTHHPAPTPKHS